MTNDELVLYRITGRIRWITLNRPNVLNALSVDLLESLVSVLDQVAADERIDALIISGAGDTAFSAGADIQFLRHATPLDVRHFAYLSVTVNQKLETLGKVAIAALNGHALGGGLELAEACMLRVAVRHAHLGHPEVRIGELPNLAALPVCRAWSGKGAPRSCY